MDRTEMHADRWLGRIDTFPELQIPQDCGAPILLLLCYYGFFFIDMVLQVDLHAKRDQSIHHDEFLDMAGYQH
jgi:hypothetical protein